jgi:hypothetical protein
MLKTHSQTDDRQTVSSEIHPISKEQHKKIGNGNRTTINTAQLYQYRHCTKTMADDEPSSSNGGGKRKSAAGNTRSTSVGMTKSKPKQKTKKSKLEIKRSNMLGKRGRGAPIVFDPEARTEYLQGFSTRKKERRAYGLAMQKVKDRKARLESRGEIRTAMREQVEEAEKQKALMMAAVMDENASLIGVPDFGKPRKAEEPEVVDKDKGGNDDEEEATTTVQMYKDDQAQSQWGGEVIVSISTAFPDEDDGDDAKKKINTPSFKTSVDESQKYAGNVEKFLNKVKGKMPAKKKAEHQRNIKQKGIHGASLMKGMAGSGDLKDAKNILAKSQAKMGKKANPSSGKGKSKRR